MIKRPMLACSQNVTLDDLQSLQYPIYASPKLDGIRCLLGSDKDGTIRTFSRKLKEIPNVLIQDFMRDHGIEGLDGEIIIPDKSFNEIQSYVMTKYTLNKQWEYHIFDQWSTTNEHYLLRLQQLQTNFQALKLPPNFIQVPVAKVSCATNLKSLFEDTISLKYEGLILRSAFGPYKQGRSTWNQGWMLKMKQFEDAEAEIIGFEPYYENQNESKKDETGYAKKSSHKANLKALEKLGAFIVRDCKDGRQFNVGSGITDAQRVAYWARRQLLKGSILTYKFQVQGQKENPRSPIFKGIRRD